MAEARYPRLSADGEGLLACQRSEGSYRQSENWRTFIRNHARTLLACDFMVAVTARFRILYIFVVMEIGSRRILYCNVTRHPTSDWTIQQLRQAIPSDHQYRYLVHDRHSDNVGYFSHIWSGTVKVGTNWRSKTSSMSFCKR